LPTFGTTASHLRRFGSEISERALQSGVAMGGRRVAASQLFEEGSRQLHTRLPSEQGDKQTDQL
jgi:hypothetical protein